VSGTACGESLVEKLRSDMHELMNVSVCMATYNGETYLSEQVASILEQMGSADELVVVDDASHDGTVSLLELFGDRRVKVHRNERNMGHVQTFSKVISLASNPIILMADQDDVWIKGRVQVMRESLAGTNALVSSNSDFIDSEGRPTAPLHVGLCKSDSHRYALNITRIFTGEAFYDGCAMGLRSEFRVLILPIPRYVESHDLWIAMAANLAKSNLHLEQITLKRRVHGQNASVVSRKPLRKLWSRAIFVLSLLHLSLRLLTRHRTQF
jgi:glycosyltransferase involved in cell wall biosynthesis